MPVAPVIVTLVALAAAALIATVAAQNLQASSDDAAEVRAKTLVAALSARLAATPLDERQALMAHAALRTGVDFVLFEPKGLVLFENASAPIDPSRLPSFEAQGSGRADVRGRRVAFAVRSLNPPLERLSLAAFVDAPNPAEGSLRMTKAVALLTLLMLTVAVAVALVFTGATREDLGLIRRQIEALANPSPGHAEALSRAQALPLRSFDQVGTLTAALNGLVARFADAERDYRLDREAAAAIDTERSEFLAGLSHELRTPLNAVLGFSHLLESESDGPLSPDAHEALAMIRTSGEHLKALIDDILDLSAAETGQLRLSRTVVDVCALTEEVAREARVTVGSRPIALYVDAVRPALAWADGRRLRQVLTNLVSNALKATASGEVRLRVAHDPHTPHIVVVVSDTGRGIDPRVLGTIFEPYRQAGDEAARRGGAGLGLAITRKLVLLHDGMLDARSDVGRGSVFTVRIPDDSASGKLPSDSLVPWGEDATGSEPARDVLPSLSSEITERRKVQRGKR